VAIKINKTSFDISCKTHASLGAFELPRLRHRSAGLRAFQTVPAGAR
jgi:hypothetical protein